MVALAAFPLPAGSPLAYLAPVVVFAVVVASWVLLRRHDRSLCEQCLHAMPLDAAASAQRYRRRLAVAHLGQDRRAVLGYLVVLIGSNGLLFLGTTWALVLWAVIESSMVYPVVSHSTHRRLQPWCRWCSDGGGGDDVVDTPDPLPVGGTKVG